MRIAVMADIHSNHVALDACMEEAVKQGAEEFLFLGDYLGEFAYPERTLELIRQIQAKYPCTFLRGNKEDYWLNHRDGKDSDWKWQDNTSGSGMLKYNYDRLKEEELCFFEKMPIAKRMEYPNLPPFVICHGSPWKNKESLREDYDYIDRLTKKLETELTICGHFHMQCAYTRHGKRIVNPGSVGVSLFSGAKAQFMMLIGEKGVWDYEFISLTYDTKKVLKELEEEHLQEQAPAWCRTIKAMLLGKQITQMQVLTKACEYYKQYTGIDDWKNIPEKYWEMALEELGI